MPKVSSSSACPRCQRCEHSQLGQVHDAHSGHSIELCQKRLPETLSSCSIRERTGFKKPQPELDAVFFQKCGPERNLLGGVHTSGHSTTSQPLERGDDRRRTRDFDPGVQQGLLHRPVCHGRRGCYRTLCCARLGKTYLYILTCLWKEGDLVLSSR